MARGGRQNRNRASCRQGGPGEAAKGAARGGLSEPKPSILWAGGARGGCKRGCKIRNRGRCGFSSGPVCDPLFVKNFWRTAAEFWEPLRTWFVQQRACHKHYVKHIYFHASLRRSVTSLRSLWSKWETMSKGSARAPSMRKNNHRLEPKFLRILLTTPLNPPYPAPKVSLQKPYVKVVGRGGRRKWDN